MKKLTFTLPLLLFVVLLLYIPACGSGSSSDDDSVEGLEALGTLSGTIYYDGDLQGEYVIVGLIDEWPMTGPPKQFEKVLVPESGFPMDYEIEIRYTGEYFLAAFLDVDPMDGVSMNAEVDALDVPDEGEAKTDVVEGENFRDFTLVDPENVDWWWLEE